MNDTSPFIFAFRAINKELPIQQKFLFKIIKCSVTMGWEEKKPGKKIDSTGPAEIVAAADTWMVWISCVSDISYV